MGDPYTSRRHVLATLGVAGTGCFAGCNDVSDNNSTGDDDRGNKEPDSTPNGGSVAEDQDTSENNQQNNDQEGVNQAEDEEDEEGDEAEDEDSGPVIESFVDVSGTDLIVNGQEVHFFGTRPMHVMPFTEPESEIEAIFDELNRIGATLARVHAFQPFWGEESKQPTPGEYNEQVMKRLDKVIEAGRSRGIRTSLMLINAMPAFHNAEIINDNYGVNAHTYANYAESAEEYNDFYTNKECKQLYKQRVSSVLTRENSITGMQYNEDPAIAMLELGNEIEWDEHWKRDSSSLKSWIEEMSSHIRTVDDNHLITTGMYGWAGRNTYVEDHKVENVDVCSLHYYPGPLSYDLENDPDRSHPSLLEEFIQKGQDEVGKPVYVGEYNWMVESGKDPPLPERNQELRVMHEVLDRTDVSAAAFHALGRKENQQYPRGSATSYADIDDGSMKEFRRFAEIQHQKSEDGSLNPLPQYQN